MDIKINKAKFTDTDIILDALYSEKELAKQYNDLILDCTTVMLRTNIISILCEIYRIHGELLEEMKKRNWLFTLPIEEETASKIKDNLLKKDNK